MNSKQYLKKQIFIPLINEKDELLGKIERWKAHKEGILHRAFTLRLIFEKNVILQHRKHIVFDGYYDATISSHQMWLPKQNRFQTMQEAMEYTLHREWNLKPTDITKPRFIEKLKYRAHDPASDLLEHEIDYIYQAKLKTLNMPNLEFAYGMSLIPQKEFENAKKPYSKLFAPWVK